MCGALQAAAERMPSLRRDDFEALLDCQTDAAALIQRGKVVAANQALAALLDFRNPQDLIGRHLCELRAKPYHCILDKSLESEGQLPNHYFDVIRSDKSEVRVSGAWKRFRGERGHFLLLTLRPATEREKLCLLCQSERRYRLIFQAAAIGILQCAPDGRVLENNDAIERMLGFSRTELQQMQLQELFPEEPGLDALFQLLEKSETRLRQQEIRYRTRAQTERWVRLTASTVAELGKHPPFLLVMIEDIAAYKEAERKLRDAQKMEAIGRLVGGVAHDFNNLLTGVMLYSDLLQSALPPDSRSARHAEEIRMAGEQGAALVQQLLAIARQQVVEPRVLNLNAKITETRNLLSRLIGENVHLHTQLAEDLGEVRMDPAQVQQILLNLVLNARDALPGGGWIRVRTTNCNFQPPAQALPTESIAGVLISVSDNGCGMGEETRAHLFEPFFTTKSAGRGNGLGLATVHEIVAKCGGRIDVDSSPGYGTTFRVYLPRLAGTPVSQAPETRYSPRTCRATILVVEDNVTVRLAVLSILRDCGYTVLEAGSYTEALAKVDANNEVDLLLADLVLPEVSGRNLAHRLRAKLPGLKCLYMSGYEPETKLEHEESDPVVFFRKPFTGSTLLQAVREVLDVPIADEERR
jgi:PAS domain S-box-containing protein